MPHLHYKTDACVTLRHLLEAFGWPTLPEMNCRVIKCLICEELKVREQGCEELFIFCDATSRWLILTLKQANYFRADSSQSSAAAEQRQ